MSSKDNALTNPALPGERAFIRTPYNTSGVQYPPSMENYLEYNKPGTFTAGTIDYSSFMTRIARDPLGPDFPCDAVRGVISGHAFIPKEGGPCPLAVFVHGDYSPWETNSGRGYFYLCELLASHGIIAVTVNISYLRSTTVEQTPFGENIFTNQRGCRALAVLEHIKQFGKWNSEGGHYLENRIDMSKILLVGHSFGGEAVAEATYIYKQKRIKGDPYHPDVPLDGSHKDLGPYNFNIVATLGLAPTFGMDFGQYPTLPLLGDCYFMHGTRDRAISFSHAYQAYSISHQVLPFSRKPGVAAPGLKGIWQIFQGTHAYFNTEWEDHAGKAADEELITPEQQRETTKVYVGALAQYYLLDQPQYKALLIDHRLALNADDRWIPEGVKVVSQFQGNDRLFVQHNQEMTEQPKVSLPLKGQITLTDDLLAFRHPLDYSPQGGTETPYFNRIMVMRVHWISSNARYSIDLEPIPWPEQAFRSLSLTVAQTRAPANPPGQTQDFSLVIHAAGQATRFLASDFGTIVYPDADVPNRESFAWVTPQTLHFPLDGIDVKNIERIVLEFDQRPSGSLFLSDLHFAVD